MRSFNSQNKYLSQPSQDNQCSQVYHSLQEKEPKRYYLTSDHCLLIEAVVSDATAGTLKAAADLTVPSASNLISLEYLLIRRCGWYSHVVANRNTYRYSSTFSYFSFSHLFPSISG